MPQKPTIRHYDLDFVAKRISAFAKSAGIAGDPVTYALVDCDLVPHDTLTANGALLMKALNFHRRVVTVSLPLVAERISVKSNARVFGMRRRPGTTARVQLRTEHGKSVFRECTARTIVGRHLDAGGGIGIPAVRARDRKGGAWLIEDFVVGTQPSAEEIAGFVTSHLAGLYRPTVRPRRVRRIARPGGLIDRLDGILRALAPGFPPIGDRDWWLAGICHNDLNTSNHLKDRDGRMWIIDWENAGVAPLISDFGRLYLLHPHLKETLLEMLESFDRDRVAMPPVHQLALGAAFEGERQARLQEVFVRDAVRSGRKTREQALDDNRAMLLAAERAIRDLEAEYA